MEITGEKMRIEYVIDHIFRHLYRISLLSSIYTPLMLLVSISFNIWIIVNNNNIPSYVGIPIVFLGLTILLLFVTYLLVDKIQVQRNQKRAEFLYNPVMNMSFTPFQQMQLIGRDVSLMEYFIDGDKEKLKDKLEMVKRWSETGFIDKEKDVPKSIKKYFRLKNERI